MNEKIELDAERVIAFRPEIARHLGSINAALLFQQLSYWADKGHRPDGFIYKSAKEIEEETTLTVKQQRTARDLLVEMGWIEVRLMTVGSTPILHFRPIVQMAKSILLKGQMHIAKEQKAFVQKGKSIYEQESTQENTPIYSSGYALEKNSSSLIAENPESLIRNNETPKHKKYEPEVLEAMSTVYDYYCEVHNKNKRQFQLTDKRQIALANRLKHFGVDEIKTAIYNGSVDPFWSGQTARGGNLVADLDYIIRNDQNLEKLTNLKIKPVTEYKERIV